MDAMHGRWLLVALLAFPACGGAPRSEPPAMVPDPRPVTPEVMVSAAAVGKITADSLLLRMSVQEKVGQVLMPWLAGAYTAFDSEAFNRAAAWIDSFAVGGIVVSIGSPLDVAAKLNQLQSRSPLPLLIAADLEWGAAMRFTGATGFPMPMAVGATGRELDAYQMGRVTALEARAIGVHMTFSPVGDVNNNPLNPIINTRSFGEDPRAVGTLISAYIRGAAEHGLYTTAKHFPGHGDTGIDSHLSLPFITGCWDRLNSLELVPFRAAIAAGVTAVMTAHIVYACEGVDSLPATLSRTLTTDVLRDSLAFGGLVVTDALDMGAIITGFGAGESAVRAFLAGSDILLMPSDLRAAQEAMIGAVGSGRVSMERLDRSVRRILDLKLDGGLFHRRTVSLDSLPTVVGQRAFQDIADDLAQRALVLVQRGPLETFRATRGRVAVITYAEETNLGIGGPLVAELRAAGDTVGTFRLYPASGALSYDSARAVIRGYPRTIFATSVRPISGRGHVALPDSLARLILWADTTRATVVASFGSPYLLHQLPGFRSAYLLAWSDVSATERAVARALSLGAPITGRLPVSISESHPRGFGVELPARRE